MNRVTVLIEDIYDEGNEIRRLHGLLLLDERYALVKMDYGNALRIIPVKATSKPGVYEYTGGGYKHVFIFDRKLDDNILDHITEMSAVEFLRSIAHQRRWDAF